MPGGLLDTSVIVDWDDPAVVAGLPDEVAVSTITMAELAAGPHFAPIQPNGAPPSSTAGGRALFDPLDFDQAAARSDGLVVAAVAASGRSHRRRLGDLLIAAVAHANGLALYTRNANDVAGLDGLISVVAV